jgi:LysM domain
MAGDILIANVSAYGTAPIPHPQLGVGGEHHSGDTTVPQASPDPVATPASAEPPPSGSAPAGGTNVYNNLENRDPDLIHVGETVKVEVNGKIINHVVKDGETLSSIAAKYGVTVNAVIATNHMKASLLGKGKDGQYFSVGPMQPSPGTMQANPPTAVTPSTTSPVTATTSTDNTQQPSEDALQALKDTILTRIGGDDRDAPEVKEAMALIDKALGGTKLTSDEIDKLAADQKKIETRINDNQQRQQRLNPLTA